MYYGVNTGSAIKISTLQLYFSVSNRSIQLTGNRYWAFQSNGKGQAYEEQLNTVDTSKCSQCPPLSEIMDRQKK